MLEGSAVSRPLTSQWAADIRIVMAGLRFILRVLPLVFWPLQTIDFIGYSACLICGVGLRASWRWQVRRTPP
jgi:hypothetical protein